ncbi:uroporphyrinogen-III synthase [Planctomicrobium sp. SH664]|uniref:uroporphyrinogen-III synthase n=1 Tax=Planctomicrobium sp. SH664 TaxID=3448125 RepID=UPI003F5CBCAA
MIEKFGGQSTVAPSMREIPLDDNADVFVFAEQLLAAQIDIVIFMTGVGTEALFQVLAGRDLTDAVRLQLATCLVAARGPKPVAALNKLGIRIDVRAPEPNTWHELTAALQAAKVSFQGRVVAVQEYGAPSTELYAWLRDHGSTVLPVPVYRWALPEDLAPLQDAIRQTLAGNFDVLLFTSAQQIVHLSEVAEQMGVRERWRAAAARCVIGSIGPTASERLREYNLPPDLEPSHPKMAHLIRESLEQAPALLQQKQQP